MTPTPHALQSLVGKRLSIDPALAVPAAGGALQEKSHGVALQVDDDGARLVTAPSGEGLWVPGGAGGAVIGHLAGPAHWAATATRGACRLVMGKNHRTGQVYAAHVPDGRDEAWRRFRSRHDMTEWQALLSEGADGSVVFACCEAGRVRALVRVEVQASADDPLSGRVTKVQVLAT